VVVETPTPQRFADRLDYLMLRAPTTLACSTQLSFTTRGTPFKLVLSTTLKTRIPLLHVASAPTSNRTLETWYSIPSISN